MASASKDPYHVLGLADDADPASIERAYREILEQIDEDIEVMGGSIELEELRREVQEAYRVLSDPEHRAAVDTLRREAWWWSDSDPALADDPVGPGDDEFDHASVLEDLLQRYLRTDEGEERETVELVLPFELAALGGRARLRIPMRAACSSCGGTGGAPGTTLRCGGCGGDPVARESCTVCGGLGWHSAVSCSDCRGAGWRAALGGVTVPIPAGVGNGTMLPFPGFGGAATGSSDGPRQIRVKVTRHPFFRRRGRDVLCRIPISEEEARRGRTISVRTIRGTRHSMQVPADTTDGTIMRIEGEGIETEGQRGDQLVEIRIRTRQGRKSGG